MPIQFASRSGERGDEGGTRSPAGLVKAREGEIRFPQRLQIVLMRMRRSRLANVLKTRPEARFHLEANESGESSHFLFPSNVSDTRGLSFPSRSTALTTTASASLTVTSGSLAGCTANCHVVPWRRQIAKFAVSLTGFFASGLPGRI